MRHSTRHCSVMERAPLLDVGHDGVDDFNWHLRRTSMREAGTNHYWRMDFNLDSWLGRMHHVMHAQMNWWTTFDLLINFFPARLVNGGLEFNPLPLQEAEMISSPWPQNGIGCCFDNSWCSGRPGLPRTQHGGRSPGQSTSCPPS